MAASKKIVACPGKAIKLDPGRAASEENPFQSDRRLTSQEAGGVSIKGCGCDLAGPDRKGSQCELSQPGPVTHPERGP